MFSVFMLHLVLFASSHFIPYPVDVNSVSLEEYGKRNFRLKNAHSMYSERCEDCTALNEYKSNQVMLIRMAQVSLAAKIYEQIITKSIRTTAVFTLQVFIYRD